MRAAILTGILIAAGAAWGDDSEVIIPAEKPVEDGKSISFIEEGARADALKNKGFVDLDKLAQKKRRKILPKFKTAMIWVVKKKTNAGSFIFSWDPLIYPNKRWNFGYNLGVTQFESESVGTFEPERIWVSEYSATASYYITRRHLPEVFIGGQIWHDHGVKNHLMIGVNMNWIVPRRFLKVDRIYLGSALMELDGTMSSVFRGGFGFRF
jgi:hypothetical protein